MIVPACVQVKPTWRVYLDTCVCKGTGFVHNGAPSPRPRCVPRCVEQCLRARIFEV